MNKTPLFRRIMNGVLALTLIFGCLVIREIPTVNAAAQSESAESQAPGSSVEPTTKAPDGDSAEADISQQTVYYWHKGLPPNDGKEYYVLMVWKDKYFFLPNGEFYKSMKNNNALYGTKNGTWVKSPYNEVPISSGGLKKSSGSFPTGSYGTEVSYYANAENRVSRLDFDYNVLKDTGTAVSFSIPSLPVMKIVPKETPGRDETEDDLSTRVLIGVRPTEKEIEESTAPSMLQPGVTNWLTGFKYMDYQVEESSIFGIKYDDTQHRTFRWYLQTINDYTREDIPKYKEILNWATKATSTDDFLSKTLDRSAWYVTNEDGQYTFSVRGYTYIERNSRISESFSDWRKVQALRGMDPAIRLGYSTSANSSLATYGLRGVPAYGRIGSWYSCEYETRDKYYFDVYYAEPNLMYFLKSDITVENGQTQNLDGPLKIEEGVTITVKKGGVLSMTDWIVNDGEILIESGGTVIVEKAQTGNGWVRNSVVVPSQKDAGTRCGRIACDGLLIVMPDCTVAGGGIYGIQFGEGAQCVLYGSLVSENIDVYTNEIIDLRSSDSYYYGGWSIIDSGFFLTASTVRDNYSCLGFIQTTSTLKVAFNGIYSSNGEQDVGRGFVISTIHGRHTATSNRSGTVARR